MEDTGTSEEDDVVDSQDSNITDRPRPSSPELFNKDDNASCESLNNLRKIVKIDWQLNIAPMYV